MRLIEYFVDDFLVIVIVLGFLALRLNSTILKLNRNKILTILLIEVAAITLFDTLEYYCSTLSYYNYGRVIFSFLCYSLRPFIIITFISLLTENKMIKYFYSLSIINTIIYASCFFSNITFSFTNENSFQRGPLGYTVHIVCLIYLLLLIILIIKKHYRNAWGRTFMLAFIALVSTIAAFLDLYASSTLFDQTILICVLFYYLFLYMEHSKVDELTDVYNRNTFFNDINKYDNKITAIISFDMNGLKIINDTYGHLEGDKAIQTLAKALLKNIKYNVNFYRTGGDEFVGLCFDLEEDKVKSVIKNVKNELNKTKYTFSCGYVMCDKNDDKDDVYKKADKMMYKDKEVYYSKHERKNRN
jgi:diguanylate cyclase (GGDEF)-like protein